ncbi:hypothetical protein [Novosphingobium sp. ST904]|uniref:hypothetical protein n=1 Tax=Novosphingobium sp. ST904 TaxID=1684385 RepID=UPI000AF8D1CF|nr:hypothetical protein [Novosphingobium sp. ST904]TCM27782.1 hypothetical protein EDF59_13144 [Novosphingobium sp. ST904]
MSALAVAKAPNPRSAGTFEDGDLPNGNSYFEGEGDRIAARKKERYDINGCDTTPGKYRYLVKPNKPEAVSPHIEGDVVLPVSGAFQRKVIGKKSMNTLQEWEGYVSSITPDSFEAILADLTDRSRGQERAVIPLSLLDGDEIEHLKLGAIFRMVIGLAITENGNRINDHVIYFRRYMPALQPKRKKFSELVHALS